MTLQPGDYLTNIKIEQCDARWGAGLFNCNGMACYVLNKDLPEITIKPGTTINKLVCVRQDTITERFYCKQPGCHEDQIDVLYRGKKVYPFVLRRYTDTWLNRWKKVVLNREKIEVQPAPVTEKHVLPGRQWVAIKHTDWEMVVPVFDHFSAMEGTYHFFPSFMHWTENKLHAPKLLSAYRDDNLVIGDTSPLVGSLEITGTDEQCFPKLQVMINIHPILNPIKFHFGIWKHCLPGEKISKIREYWHQLFKLNGINEEDMPGRVKCNQIFASCQRNEENNNCQVCPQNQFIQVHSQIRPFCEVFQQTAVTFFRKHLTDDSGGTIVHLEQVFPDVFGIQVVFQTKPLVNKHPKKTRHRCVFRGIMFLEGQKGVIHISPVTQYTTKNRAPFIGLKKNMFVGKLHHVQKPN